MYPTTTPPLESRTTSSVLGFNLVAYGCTTCIGNSGPLADPITEAIEEGGLAVAALLSGNRNLRPHQFGGPRRFPCFATPGHRLCHRWFNADQSRHQTARPRVGWQTCLSGDLWPSNREVGDFVGKSLTPEMFRKRYQNVFEGSEAWREIETPIGQTLSLGSASTYIAHPPYFDRMAKRPEPLADISLARPLAIFGDSVTTDHISPAGSIKTDSPAGKYLIDRQVRPLNSIRTDQDEEIMK